MGIGYSLRKPCPVQLHDVYLMFDVPRCKWLLSIDMSRYVVLPELNTETPQLVQLRCT